MAAVPTASVNSTVPLPGPTRALTVVLPETSRTPPSPVTLNAGDDNAAGSAAFTVAVPLYPIVAAETSTFALFVQRIDGIGRAGRSLDHHVFEGGNRRRARRARFPFTVSVPYTKTFKGSAYHAGSGHCRSRPA
jgi:hypothetical protein